MFVFEIYRLISNLTDANIRSSLITNGTLLNEQLAHKLKNVGLSGMQISIHASNSKLHDIITKTSGSFDETIIGIENAIKVFSPETINVNMVLIGLNYHEVEPLMKLLSDMGVVQFSIGFLSKTGNALSENIYVNRDQILHAFHTMVGVSKESNLEIGISGGFPICVFSQEEQGQIINLSANICDAGLNQLVISPIGDIRACVCLPQILGNIFKDDPKKIWRNSSFLQFLRRLEHVPNQCYKCDLVSVCKGGCRAAAYCTYGNFKEIDPIMEV